MEREKRRGQQLMMTNDNNNGNGDDGDDGDDDAKDRVLDRDENEANCH